MKILQYTLFYLLSLTWGIIMTSVGLLAALVLLITGHKPKRFHHTIYFEVGRGWGGISLGPIILVSKNSSLHTKQHEAGHGIQNALLGPLFPLIVALPSAARYWIYNFNSTTEKKGFVAVLGCVSVLLSAVAITVGAVWALWTLSAILGAIAFYVMFLVCWLWFDEIPRHIESTPPYDSIWFEGNATKTGKKYFGGDNEQN